METSRFIYLLTLLMPILEIVLIISAIIALFYLTQAVKIYIRKNQ